MCCNKDVAYEQVCIDTGALLHLAKVSCSGSHGQFHITSNAWCCSCSQRLLLQLDTAVKSAVALLIKRCNGDLDIAKSWLDNKAFLHNFWLGTQLANMKGAPDQAKPVLWMLKQHLAAADCCFAGAPQRVQAPWPGKPLQGREQTGSHLRR